MKRALVFDPYFDTLGGGEKYTAGVVLALEQAGYAVTLAWHDQSLLNGLNQRFGVTFNNVTIDADAYHCLVHGNGFSKRALEQRFDYLFWISDGSLPWLWSGRNVVHFQVPFHRSDMRSLANKLKWQRIHTIVCNSRFTNAVIKQTYGVDGTVVYPPCQPMPTRPKTSTILSVGRFDGLLHNKRQDVLIDTLRKLRLPSGWKLVLAGGNLNRTDNLAELKRQAADLPIQWVINPSHSEIAELYGQASIFWHAAGFGVDEAREPEKVEHFGIATVEAMSAGAVPLVYNAGGQKEIVTTHKNGYLWQTVEELAALTQTVIEQPALRQALSRQATETSKQFSLEKFIHAFIHTCIG